MQGFAQRLKQEREQRLWSQEQVAEMIGTTAPSVSRWERGNIFPGLHFRQKLCELFGKSAEELGFLQENTRADNHSLSEEFQEIQQVVSSGPYVNSQFWYVPYGKNPFFTGREDAIQHLHTLLHTGNTCALERIQALCGLGGIGKTQTAVEYAYRYRNEYQAVLWSQAETKEVLYSGFVKLATLLKLPDKGQSDEEQQVNAVKRWLNNNQNWLLILDNMDDLSILQDFIPPGSRGAILLTTRTQSTRTFAHRINLEQMEPDEGALLLLRRSVRIECDASLEDASSADRSIAREISRMMGGLPLALDQAGAYIEETACSLSDYLERYQKRRPALLSLRDFRGGVSTTHPQSVTATFTHALESVERANPAAVELLRLCAFLQPDAIPESILMEDDVDFGPVLQPLAADPFMFDTAIAVLRTHSLLRRNTGTRTLALHCLVQAVLRDTMNAETQHLWSERALRASDSLRLCKRTASR
ncbi:MAG TPA: helix-turn-helix domain-containing protein [Ktedonobacteraceae bacterium]|nr:helix-turn-helix domain-containing protein [Ktedonobacteraceae bacterium]